MKWVAFFSQTGSEIYNITQRIGRVPDLIMTNNLDRESWHPGIHGLDTKIIAADHANLMDASHITIDDGSPLVTLHGYLRILPAEFVERFEVINGHPGDIETYPDLKGKDPQVKALELGIPFTGVVLHKAVAEVDAGEILKREAYAIIHSQITIEQLILDLKDIQLKLWCELLGERL